MYKEGQLVSVRGGTPYQITHIFDGGELFKVDIPFDYSSTYKPVQNDADSISEQYTSAYAPDTILYGSII